MAAIEYKCSLSGDKGAWETPSACSSTNIVLPSKELRESRGLSICTPHLSFRDGRGAGVYDQQKLSFSYRSIMYPQISNKTPDLHQSTGLGIAIPDIFNNLSILDYTTEQTQSTINISNYSNVNNARPTHHPPRHLGRDQLEIEHIPKTTRS